jgi:hypothetical protein
LLFEDEHKTSMVQRNGGGLTPPAAGGPAGRKSEG